MEEFGTVRQGGVGSRQPDCLLRDVRVFSQYNEWRLFEGDFSSQPRHSRSGIADFTSITTVTHGPAVGSPLEAIASTTLLTFNPWTRAVCLS